MNSLSQLYLYRTFQESFGSLLRILRCFKTPLKGFLLCFVIAALPAQLIAQDPEKILMDGEDSTIKSDEAEQEDSSISQSESESQKSDDEHPPKKLASPITTILPHRILDYAAAGKTANYRRKILIRLPDIAIRLKLDPFFHKRLAYIEKRTGLLKVVHLQKKHILTVGGPGIGQGFLWAPDGSRLIYRKQVIRRPQSIYGSLTIYNYPKRSSFVMDSFPFLTGMPSLDPRSQELLLYHPSGIIRKKLHIPESRLAKWQISRGDKNGLFAATPQGILHVSPTKRGMTKLRDDGSGVQSFAISPDGQKIVWATEKNRIYLAQDQWSYQGATARLIAFGIDPSWSADSQNIVFAGARTIGRSVSGYDLRKVNLQGQGMWLTKTFDAQERWPAELRDGVIIFTIEKTTDLFALIPAPNPTMVSSSEPLKLIQTQDP